MNSAREIFEIDDFISNLMDESLHLAQANGSLGSTKSDLSSSPLSPGFDEILLTDSSRTATTTFPKLITHDENNNALISSHIETSLTEEEDLEKPIERKILSLIGSYFINSPDIIKHIVTQNHLKSINEFSLHQQLDSLSPSFHGLIKTLIIDDMDIGELFIDLTKTNISSKQPDILNQYKKLKLYANNHLQSLLADVKSYTFDLDKQELHFHLDNFKLSDIPKLDKPAIINPKQMYDKDNFVPESIKFAQKNQSNQVKNTIIEKRTSYFQNDDQQQLLKFIQNQINNHQWPLQEYIGIKGQRSWRALKLASDISNYDDGFMLNYHNDLDWISTDENFGSFGERTSLIIRNFERRIEQHKN
jgi:hypothetical protein